MAGVSSAQYLRHPPPPSLQRSPDTASPVYPERAIRPLPKSRLKSKLSPEQASTIVYPPEPPPQSPTLNFHLREEAASHPAHRVSARMINGDDASHHVHPDHRPVHNHCTCGDHCDSGDDEVEFDHPDYRYPELQANAGGPIRPNDQRLLNMTHSSVKPPPPGSVASSADGYESFENTSNKKKRKIPLSAVSNLHQSQLSAEMANMGLSNGHVDGASDEVVGVNGLAHQRDQHYAAYQASAGSGTGISGAGRGRYGRQDARARRPLASSTMNTVNGYNSRVPARGSDSKRTADTGIENTGIISQAIKAAEQQGPMTPIGKGKENMSLVQSAASANSTTPKTQFTFTCESDSASKMVDQSMPTHAYAAGTPTPARTGAPGTKGVNMQSGQVGPARSHAQAPNVARPPPPHGTAPAMGHQQQPVAPPPKPRPRRNPAKEYALQAHNRKKQQQYQNWHSRTKMEDIWICDFCEYEDIYGVPPHAMIRKYEIKDRQERKKAAEKRRLLEKAKMKGRKNKKTGKGGKNSTANNATAPAVPTNPQNYDPNLPPPDGEEYYDDEDEYGDEYEPVGPDDQYHQDYYPPPAPIGTPAALQAGSGAHRPHG